MFSWDWTGGTGGRGNVGRLGVVRVGEVHRSGADQRGELVGRALAVAFLTASEHDRPGGSRDLSQQRSLPWRPTLPRCWVRATEVTVKLSSSNASARSGTS